MDASRLTFAVAAAALCAACSSAPVRPALAATGAVGAPLVPVAHADVHAESGSLVALPGDRLGIRTALLRARVGTRPRSQEEIEFVYLGPSRDSRPLASGEMRRQIGLKLRAQDTCNVVYVMWHIAPADGLHVAVKSNPGKSFHSQCGDGGYLDVAPRRSRRVAAIGERERHRLSASLEGDRLRVTADGALAWEGTLPPQALAFDGPVGLRSDNGAFDVQVRVPSQAGGSAPP